MSQESHKVIYSMMGVSRAHNKKVVLEDISLSYFYGGLNRRLVGVEGAGVIRQII